MPDARLVAAAELAARLGRGLIDLRGLDAHRIAAGREVYGKGPDAGAFLLRSPQGVLLMVIATSSDGWEHVSVSHRTRCPTWDEMEFVKRRLFRPWATVMQLHVPPSDHISLHPFCLHLWRPLGQLIPRPPNELVV